MARHDCWILGQRGLYAGRQTIDNLRFKHGHEREGPGNGGFTKKTVHFLFQIGTEITSSGPAKAAFSFVYPLDLIIQNLCGRPIHSFEDFHRIRI